MVRRVIVVGAGYAGLPAATGSHARPTPMNSRSPKPTPVHCCAGAGTSSQSTPLRQQPEGRAVHAFFEALQAKDVERALGLLAENVEFRSPNVSRPYRGRQALAEIFPAVAALFEDFQLRQRVQLSGRGRPRGGVPHPGGRQADRRLRLRAMR
jgi:hypothetical protein